MTNSKLIEMLKMLPPEESIVVFDINKNTHYATGDETGTPEGIYSKIIIGRYTEAIKTPFSYIMFENEDYDKA